MKKNILMIGFLLLMAVLFLKGTKIQSVDEYPRGFRDGDDQHPL